MTHEEKKLPESFDSFFSGISMEDEKDAIMLYEKSIKSIKKAVVKENVDWREINGAIMDFQIHVRKVTGGNDFDCVDSTELKSVIKQTLAKSIQQTVAEEREKIRKEITVIFSGEEKDLQDLLNAPSLKVDK